LRWYNYPALEAAFSLHRTPHRIWELMTNLDGKHAVVLGCSAPGGTGWAIAEGLAAAGAKVVVGARTEGPLQRLAGKIGGTAVVCDAASHTQIARLAQTAVATYGRIDIAVNSAALAIRSTISSATSEVIQPVLDVNYVGNVYFIQEMAAAMNDGGSIVIISSSSAQQPVEGYFAYACSKAATDCLVKYAAIEYGKRGIRVNSVLPGPIRSDMARHIYETPGGEEAYAREVPLGRVGEPRDYADVVLWLSGPAFVTGLNLPVSGGNQLTRTPRADELPASLR
jgi:NAD(P)-dependent dehydrogenase (short-subunit alcohol dehydrogenase family)